MIILFLITNINLPRTTSAEESLCYYAKVTSAGTYFYSSPAEEGKIFELPQTYFVLLTDDANEEFYSAKYGNYLGYVKKSEVSPMKGTPTSPYATKYNLRITSMSGLPLFSQATFDSEEILNIEFLEDKICFYGTFQGQEFFENSTDIWYFCSYTKNNKTEYGYLFSYYCNFVANIQDNNEFFEEITAPLVFKPQPQTSTSLSDTIKALIILGVIIPVLIGIYFFLTKRKPNTSKPKTAKRHKDYYELSESDLN